MCRFKSCLQCILHSTASSWSMSGCLVQNWSRRFLDFLLVPAGLGTIDRACRDRFLFVYLLVGLLVYLSERVHKLAVYCTGGESVVLNGRVYEYGILVLRVEGRRIGHLPRECAVRVLVDVTCSA